MWANAAVSGFAPITLHAEYLKTGRKLVGNQPTVYFLPAAPLDAVVNVPTMLRTVIVNMVNSQELWMGFAATGAFVSAVCVVS